MLACWREKLKWLKLAFIKSDAFVPSSKVCSSCRTLKEDLSLKDRVFKCLGCSFSLDRNLNASIIFIERGLNSWSRGAKTCLACKSLVILQATKSSN
ncbi:zinc ribbon domain-containing protein [Helicobacter salomonis]|uniref:zinc ribbon domain-containing protein n=1 Tax=Helicobacter salomonis TaxID=56878 RepID=UPI0039899E79